MYEIEECSLCSLPIENQGIQAHIQEWHLGGAEDKWVCGVCEAGESSLDAMGRHCLVLHHDAALIHRDYEARQIAVLKKIQIARRGRSFNQFSAPRQLDLDSEAKEDRMQSALKSIRRQGASPYDSQSSALTPAVSESDSIFNQTDKYSQGAHSAIKFSDSGEEDEDDLDDEGETVNYYRSPVDASALWSETPGPSKRKSPPSSISEGSNEKRDFLPKRLKLGGGGPLEKFGSLYKAEWVERMEGWGLGYINGAVFSKSAANRGFLLLREDAGEAAESTLQCSMCAFAGDAVRVPSDLAAPVPLRAPNFTRPSQWARKLQNHRNSHSHKLAIAHILQATARDPNALDSFFRHLAE